MATMKKLAVVCVLGVLGLAAYAQSNELQMSENEKYFTIGSVETHEVASPADVGLPTSPIEGILSGQDDANPMDNWSTIVNIGKQVWDMIVANKPVFDYSSDRAYAMPVGTRTWDQLAGWQKPQAHTYVVSFKNLLGGEVVNFTYRLLFTPGGSLQGKGAYLANITVLPANLEVSWGYTFHAKGLVPNVMNAGSVESPMGAAEVQVEWSVDTVLKHAQGSDSFYVRGDGTFSQL